MRDQQISKFIKIAAGVLGFFIIAATLFSAFFIAYETTHNCTGGNCPVCACISLYENLLHQLSEGATAQKAAILPTFFSFILIINTAFCFIQKTLVSRKIRLND